LLDAGFVDTYRHFHREQTAAYTWWSYRGGARQKNVGWRIDYFGVSTPFMHRVVAAGILPHVHGSDHCPVVIQLE
jgi:exodeoxyribonuclease-3